MFQAAYSECHTYKHTPPGIFPVLPLSKTPGFFFQGREDRLPDKPPKIRGCAVDAPRVQRTFNEKTIRRLETLRKKREKHERTHIQIDHSCRRHSNLSLVLLSHSKPQIRRNQKKRCLSMRRRLPFIPPKKSPSPEPTNFASLVPCKTTRKESVRAKKETPRTACLLACVVVVVVVDYVWVTCTSARTYVHAREKKNIALRLFIL